LEGIDLLEVKLEQEAMVVGDPTSERFDQLLGLRLQAGMGQLGELPRVGFTRDQRRQERTPAGSFGGALGRIHPAAGS
jgi:hypothetical protein